MPLSRPAARPSAVRARSVRARLVVEQLEAREVPYAVAGGVWVHPELVTISFVPDGTFLEYDAHGQAITSSLFADFNARWSTSTWQNAILKGTQVWARQTNVNFAVVADDGSGFDQTGQYQQGAANYGDIRIAGAHYTQRVGASFLAQAYLPPQLNNWSLAGNIEFNTDSAFNIGSTFDLFTVAAHEVGHAMGMDHSGDPNAIMNAVYPGAKTDLAADDVNGIRHIYSNDAARSADPYEGALGNNSFGTSTLVTINGTTKTALVTGADITTTSDADYYKFVVPTGSAGTLKINVQSAGLSLLAPKVYLYNAIFGPVGFANGTGQYGTTLTINYSPISALQVYYVKVVGADTSVFGTGKYAVTINTGAGADPTVPMPNTQTANGNPIVTSGGEADAPIDPTHAQTDASTIASGANVGQQNQIMLEVGIVNDNWRKDEAHELGNPSAVPAQRSYWDGLGRQSETDDPDASDLDALTGELAQWISGV